MSRVYLLANKRKWIVRLILFITKVIMVTTLIAKVITLIQHPKLIEVSDSVTTLTFSNLLIVGIAADCVLLAVLFFAPIYYELLGLLYFSLIIGAYRVVTHMAKQYWCPCLGSFANWASLSQDQVNSILNSITLFFFVGSIVCLYLCKDSRAAERL
jgi:hypothetical protein